MLKAHNDTKQSAGTFNPTVAEPIFW